MSKQDELKKIKEEAKKLREKQKAIREELAETSEARKEARKLQAECRKQVTQLKSELRELTAKTWKTFSEGDREKVIALADSITEVSTALAANVRKFGESLEATEEL